MGLLPNCLHYMCVECCEKHLDPLCPLCKEPKGSKGVMIYPSEVVAQMPINTHDALKSSAFEVLFSSNVKDVYRMIRDILVRRWSSITQYDHSPVCGVCILRQKYPDVDITLLNLFFASATITRTSILDAMVCLYLLYGKNPCLSLSPNDVFFHFFLNHCDTGRGALDINYSWSRVADFVCLIHHSLVYDISEVKEIATFIGMMSECKLSCDCNDSKHVLSNIQDRDQDSKQQYDKNEAEDNNDVGLFIPDENRAYVASTITWDNAYKWDYIPTDNDDGGDKLDGDGDEAQHLSLNCLKIFSDCKVCTDMMCVKNTALIKKVDDLVTKFAVNTNTATAVQMACVKMQLSGELTNAMAIHYKSTDCRMNRLRYFHFYSLVKQPMSLMNSDNVRHLFKELFSYKRSYLCPNYQLACACEKVVALNTNSCNRTNKDTIKKWARKIMDRHEPTYTTTNNKRNKKLGRW
ncbi:hypothetical protein RRG08_062911 [Elysia crispata]|uniref:Uncharacterized protein n=1 Tax=Elysia crispata TaxID=231223 RepID=A0AAE0YU30_9GAST|nr:hypothetical protein RRG08_062911 [Elysia crispata]